MLNIIIILSGLLIFATISAAFVFFRLKNVNKKITEELANEKEFTNYFLYASDIIFVFDVAGKIIYVNEAVRDQLGYERHSLTNKLIKELLPAEYQNEWSVMLKHVFEFKYFSGQLHFKHQDDNVSQYDYRSSIITGQENQHRVICSLRKSQIQKKNISPDYFLNDLLNILPHGCLISDNSWCVLYANELFCQTTGHSQAEIIGKKFIDFVDSDNVNDIYSLADERRPYSESGKKIRLLHRDRSQVSITIKIKNYPVHHSKIILINFVETDDRKEILQIHEAEPKPKYLASLKTENARTVLLVEDNQSLLKLTAKILERKGHKVITADQATEALQILVESRHEIAVIVSDIFMPDIDGLQLAQQIQVHYPDLPVIILTGKIDEISADIYAMKNIFKVLSKPAEPGELSKQIYAAIQAKMS